MTLAASLSLAPPLMRPARAEMLAEPCYGLTEIQFASRPLRLERCGATVTLCCPRCHVHRCAKCAPFEVCPVCPQTDPERYATVEAQ